MGVTTMKEFIGYHGTLSSYCDSIEKNGLNPCCTKNRSDHWLGQGVYFYDCMRLAKWWAECKRNNAISKNNVNHCFAVVYETNISAEDNQVLDLDDNDQLSLFNRRIIENMTSLLKEYPEGLEMAEEKYRAIYFDYYKEHYNISVIIRTFCKKQASYAKYFQTGDRLKLQQRLFDIMGIGYLEKQICVSNKECIKGYKLVYDEEEEVI